MAETAEKKKKVYKVATELNLSHETLIEFLRKKGHEVKGHMSSVDENMMKDILVHFKKEKDVAEKHQRKIHEIRETKKRAEKKAQEIVEIPVPATLPAPSAMHHGEPEPAVEAKTEEGVPPGSVETDEPEVVEASVDDGTASAPADAEDAPSVQTENHEIKKGRGEDHLSPLEKQTRSKVGLTIKGRMDLTKHPKPAGGKAKSAVAVPAVVESDDHKRKKKKKKVGGKELAETKAPDVDDLERKKKKKKKIRHKEIDQAEVTDAIRRTFAAMDDTPATGRAVLKKRKKKEREEEVARLQEEAQQEEGKLRVTEFVSVNDLANLMRVDVADVIKKCMELGIMVSINQRLDKDTITWFWVGDHDEYEKFFG